MAENKAAFGVFPQMKPRRSRQDPEAAKNFPVDVARGFVAGTLGMPGDIESFARLPYELITGNESPTILPTSEDIEKRLPLRSDAPVSKAATGLGTLGGGFYTGPLSGARAAMAVPKAIGKAGKDFVMASGQPPVNVIKPKGGNWLGGRMMGNIDNSVTGLKPYRKAGDDGTFLQKELDRATKQLEMLEGDPYKIPQMVEGQRQTVNDVKKKIAINDWVEGTLKKYVKNQMGTPDDPVRKLFDKRTQEIEEKFAKDMERVKRVEERAISEADPRRQANLAREAENLRNQAIGEREFAMEHVTHVPGRLEDYGPEADYSLKGRRVDAGFPAEGMGQSEMGKRWETLTDDAIYAMKAGDIQETKKIVAQAQEAERAVKDKQLEVAKRFDEHIRNSDLSEDQIRVLNEKTPIADKADMIQDREYGELSYAYNKLRTELRRDEFEAGQQNPFVDKLPPETDLYAGNTADMGFDHVIDVLKQDVMEGRIRPDQLNKVSMEQAVRRTAEYDQEMAIKMRETAIKNQEGFPTYKEYPEGYRWIELTTPEPKLGEGYRIIKDEPSPSNWKVVPHPEGDGYALRADNGQYAFGNRSYVERKWNTPDEARAEIPNYAEIQEPYPDEIYKILDSSGDVVAKAETEKKALNQLNSDERRKALEDALKYEGDTMGHCVGGYCPDVLEGKSRIYSLRDAKGQPHVTIELGKAQGRTAYDDMQAIYNQASDEANQANFATTGEFNNFYNDRVKELQMALIDKQQAELPERIIQIKGKQNARPIEKYDKYTQDFVKSGQWSDVGDLQNTGLVRIDPDSDLAAAFKASGKEAPSYVNQDELTNLLKWNRGEGDLPEGFKRGGKVSVSDNCDCQMMEVLDKKMQAGGIVKGLKAAVKPPKKAVPIAEAPSIVIPSGISSVKEAARQSKGEYGARRIERAADEVKNLEKFYNEKALREAFLGDNAKAVVTMNPADFEKYAQALSGRTSADIGPKMAELARQGEIDKYTVPTDEYIQHLMRLQGGFDQAPYLNLYKDEVGLPIKPEIRGHEGRHRSRALSKAGEPSSLVQISPRGDLREGLPRGSQEEYIEALREELERSGRLVLPETDGSYRRPAIQLPEPYAKGGEVHMAGGGLGRIAKMAKAAKAEKAEPSLPLNLPRATAKTKEEIRPIAQRMAQQMTGEFVRPNPKKSINPAEKSFKQFQMEQDLTHDIRPTEGKTLLPQEVADIEKQLGMLKIGVSGDTTVADKTLYRAGPYELDLPSPQHGGPLYGLGGEGAWASNNPVAATFQKRVQELSQANKDAPVLGQFLAMGPGGSNFAMHFADANLRAIDPSKMNKKQIEAFNKLIREGTQKSGPRPSFPGIEDKDSAYLHFAFDPELRKHFNALMQLPSYTSKLGLPDGRVILHAITEPELRNSEVLTSGLSQMRLDPSVNPADLMMSAHPTYSHVIPKVPGSDITRTKYPTAVEIEFPDVAEYIKQNYRPQDATRVYQTATPRQMVDPQHIDEIKMYEELMKQYTGKKAGGAVGKAAQIDGNEFVLAAQKYGLSDDTNTLNKMVSLVNQGATVDEAALTVSRGAKKADGGLIKVKNKRKAKA
jgi:hypothetical protein